MSKSKFVFLEQFGVFAGGVLLISVVTFVSIWIIKQTPKPDAAAIQTTGIPIPQLHKLQIKRKVFVN